MRLAVPSLAILGILILSLAGGAEAASKRLKPVNSPEPLKIRVGSKLSSYHVTTVSNPVEVKVKGPTSIRVLSRYLYPGDAPTDPVDYELRFGIDGVDLRTVVEEARVSTKAEHQDGRAIGSLETCTVKIPDGTHKVVIQPADEGDRIALRVFRGKVRKQETKWVGFAPRDYERAVILQGRDTETTYYRLSPDHPVKLTLHGPTRMRVMTRIDFEKGGIKSQTYALKVFIDEELWISCSFESEPVKNSDLIYPDLPELAPGKRRDKEIEIPGGEHEIRIEIDCTTAQGASVRLSIPERDVMPG